MGGRGGVDGSSCLHGDDVNEKSSSLAMEVTNMCKLNLHKQKFLFNLIISNFSKVWHVLWFFISHGLIT